MAVARCKSRDTLLHNHSHLFLSNHRYSGNTNFISQFSHMIPRQPLTAIPQSSKDVEKGLQCIVLNGVDTNHVLPKQLDIPRQEVGDFCYQLFNGTKGWVGGLGVYCTSIHLQGNISPGLRWCQIFND